MKFQVIVVGGGHAGIEAAAAAARIGANTALVTMRADRIGEMSCNPAIGGLAKGQIVREVDAMGGLMGEIADRAGIQFRVLNRSKGPAVRAPRAQEDKELYRQLMTHRVNSLPGLTVLEAEVKDIIFDAGVVKGVRVDSGEEICSQTVVITGGTFLNGLIHCGEKRIQAGRFGEEASLGLSDMLKEYGLTMGRMKTGTPPRIHKDSIDFSKFAPQPGDDPPTPFSYITTSIEQEQIHCYVGFTNTQVHQVIHENIDRSPLFSGQILGIGPRYCPSIEDKVVKFPEKDRHQVFLEPEVRGGDSIYVNGVSTSLPEDVQKAFIARIPGMERAKFIRPGYAIEYDFLHPTQLRSTLEVKEIGGLYCCGQINGTSGYEEAAAQGLIAGANAALKCLGKDEIILERESSYTGVMIQDLVIHGADEPYRMFTSRAENRLWLRSDNADRRLTEFARGFGLVDDSRWQRYLEKCERLERVKKILEDFNINSIQEGTEFGLPLKGGLKKRSNGLELLKRPEIQTRHFLPILDEFPELNDDEMITIETDEKYRGYLERSKEHSNRLNSQSHKKIHSEINYDGIPGLSGEMRDRLKKIKPETLGQAARISGITPAAITALAIELVRIEQKKSA
jgi:tRNA uridine 5-carboxymethylaminomethyl modification enzyme